MKFLFNILSTILAAALSYGTAIAHEFWISPVLYVNQSGARVEADLRVGQEFSGAPYSYRPQFFERFEILQGDTVRPVEGRMGDVPAMAVDGLADGLAIIVHETTNNSLTYREWEKFIKFTEHKAMDGIPEAHLERGLPRTGFKELYRRYAKSLVMIGSGEGRDRATGLKTEIVALNNPYTMPSDVMRVQVLMDGQARGGVQLEVFERGADGEVAITLYRTDEDGIGGFPVKRGYEYLVDSVSMLPLTGDAVTNGAVWMSLWASLTFKRP